MNALQEYVNSLVGIQETAKVDLVKQWKVDNNWNDKKNELVDIEVETNVDPEEVKIEDSQPVDPSSESSDNTGSESVNGSSAPIDPLEGFTDYEKALIETYGLDPEIQRRYKDQRKRYEELTVIAKPDEEYALKEQKFKYNFKDNQIVYYSENESGDFEEIKYGTEDYLRTSVMFQHLGQDVLEKYEAGETALNVLQEAGLALKLDGLTKQAEATEDYIRALNSPFLEIYEQQSSLSEETVNKLTSEAEEFVNKNKFIFKPVYKTERSFDPRLGSRSIKTGEVRTDKINPEWGDLQNRAAKILINENEIDKGKLNVNLSNAQNFLNQGSIEIKNPNYDPENPNKKNELGEVEPEFINQDTSTALKNKMSELKYDELKAKQVVKNIKNWIEDQDMEFDEENAHRYFVKALTKTGIAGNLVGLIIRQLDPTFLDVDTKDVFGRGKEQKEYEKFQREIKKALPKQQQAILTFQDNAKNLLAAYTTASKAIANGTYVTAEQVERAEKQLADIKIQTDKIIELMKSEYEELDKSIEKSQNADEIISALTKNYNLIPIMTHNFENALIDMGQGIEELAFQTFSLHRTISRDVAGFVDDKLGTNFTAIEAFVNQGRNYLLDKWSEGRDAANKAIDDYQTELMGSIADSISFDDIEDADDFGRYFMATLGSVAPQMAVMIATGGYGVAIVTAQAGGQKFKEYQEEIKNSEKAVANWNRPETQGGLKPVKKAKETEASYQYRLAQWEKEKPTEINYSLAEMWGGAFSVMAAEYLAGKFVSLPIINRAKGIGAATEKLNKVNRVRRGFTKEYSKQFLGDTFRYTKDVVAEGLEEVGTEAVAKLYDRIVLGKDVNIFEGWKDNFFSGLVMANGFKAPALFRPYVDAASTPGDQMNINNRRDLIRSKINSLIENPNMSRESKAAIEADIAQSFQELNNDIVLVMNRYSDMPREQIDELGKIEQQTFSIDQQINTIRNDEGITTGKEKLIEELQNNRQKLTGQKNNILKPYVTKDVEGRITGGGFISPKTRQIDAGAEVIAGQLEGVGVESVNDTESLLSVVETVEASGGELIGLQRDADGSVLPAEQQSYGVISRLPDGSQQVIINQVAAARDNVATTSQHEVLHAFLDKIFVNDVDAKTRAGKALDAFLQSDEVTLDPALQSRFDSYKQDFDNGDLSEADYFEEIITLTSEGLSANQIQENAAVEAEAEAVGDVLSDVYAENNQAALNISFDTGKGVLDFVRGFNQAVESGKGLTQQQLDLVSPEGRAAQQETARQSEQAPRNKKLMQDIVEGDIGAATTLVQENSGLILDLLKFNPDVAQQSGVTSEDVLQAVTDMMTPGMVDITFKGRKKSLAEEYADEKGEVSTFLGRLRRRAAEIYTAAGLDPNKFITESTSDSEARQIAAKEPSAKKTVKRRARTTPKASRKYPSTILNNLGVSTKAEADALFEEAIADDIANFYKGEIKEFKDIKDIGPAVAALMEKATGLKANRFSSKTQNIMKGDVESGAVTALQQLLNANAAADFAMLAEAANIEGKSTSIPGKILEALFTKNSKGKYVRDTRKGLRDYKNIIDALNIEAKKAKGKDAIYRSADAQALKGLANLSLRNLIFEQAVPDPVARTRTGARFSQKQKTQRNKRFEVSGEDGIKIMRDVAKRFAKATNTEIIVNGVELTADNFNSKSPEAISFLKSKLETDLWKYIPLESLTRGTMVDYSTKGDRSFFFDKTEYAEILKKAKQNREAWIKQGNKLDYDTKAINIAKASINPAKSTSRYLENYSKGAKQKIDANTKGVEAILQGGANAIKADSANYLPILAIYGTQSDSTSHLIRNMAVDAGVTEAYVNEKRIGETVKEHVEPSNEMAPLMFEAQLFDEVEVLMPVIEKVYYQLGITKIQDGKLSDTDGKFGESYNYITTQVEFFQNGLREYFKTGDVSKIPDPLVRYFNPEVNRNDNGDGIPGFNANEMIIKGKTVAEMFTRQLPKSDQNPNNIFVQNDLTHQVLTGQITQAEAVKLLNNQISTNNLKARQSKKINDMQPNNLKFEGTTSENSTAVVDQLNKLDKALNQGRKTNKPVKKIRVFDFDDTLAKSNSKVIVINPISDIDTDMLDIVARRKFKKEFENLPSRLQSFNNLNEQQKLEVLKETPGATTEINANQFAEQAADLEAQGATFDFSQFEQVIDGKKGPLFDVAKKIADTRGTEDLFILTARPQTAAGPIKAFMKALGINIPLSNITGLADGTPAAKGRWIASKAAEGYNDFYFADDAAKNVKAVKEVLDQIDVKSKVQQARASKKQTFNTIVNDMIESSSGIESYKTFSAAKARTIGKNKGRFDWLTLASSAEDFKGLLYRLLGNGKKGEAQYEFLKTNLIDVYNRAEDSIVQAKISAANDFMALKAQFPGIPTTLETETGVGKFNYQHALRVYMWTQQGMSIPGLSKADARKLNKFITDDAKLQSFADQLISIQKGKPYPEPGKDWLAGNLTTDIIGGINKVNRAEYQQEFRENVEIIFSPENLNKMEAAYGTRWRRALENTLKRMKAGTNRLGYNEQTSAVLDWVNNSVGAVMFLNTRSALLQTISAVNFINWGDNNIIKAGQAFANQKQFWADFMTLMNSDYLVQRRNGLKINVSESEIADAVKDSKNKVNAAISYLLSKGFVLTRYADSFAIASGGATFYRNRIKKYLKEGMDQKLAEEKAFQDFRQISEESQQSSSPDRISMQQASAAGRVILNWANTPMQYVRIQKRALQDLIAGRGDAKVHMSRIAYYGVMQNLIFNAMQQALFAIAFGDDEEDEEKSAAKKKQDDKKIARVANGMIDSQLKGLGIAGSAMVAVKNTLMKIYEESGKQRPEYEKAAIEALSFSPAISSKYRKVVGGLKSFSWNMKEIKQKGFSLDNPAYLAGAQIITAVTNIPIDRVVKKANNIRGMLSEQSQMWQKVILFGGWSTWDVGLPYYGGWDKPVEPTPAELKRQEFDKLKKDTKTADQVQMLLDLGLDKKQIKALRYEDARVKKIIELQNKKKKDE